MNNLFKLISYTVAIFFVGFWQLAIRILGNQGFMIRCTKHLKNARTRWEAEIKMARP